MITTIKIHESIKKELDFIKEGKESYEEVISKLLELAEKQKRSQKTLLIEGYKEMAEESIKLTKEWAKTDIAWD